MSDHRKLIVDSDLPSALLTTLTLTAALQAATQTEIMLPLIPSLLRRRRIRWCLHWTNS